VVIPDEFDDDAEAERSEPGEPGEFPSELRAISDGEWREAMRTAKHVALRLTRSRRMADELVSDTLRLLCTTRRWVPERGPFVRHFVYSLKSVLYNQRVSKAPERESLANEGYHREQRPGAVPSHEADLLARAEEAAEPARIARRHALAARQLAELERRIADHPLAVAVLRCKAEGLERRPAEVAACLGVPVAQVYRAIEVLKYHLKRIRDEMPEPPGDGGDGASASSPDEKHP
jgi:DNA-directed RNA polymerase specialized sigma24 family protein